jgi:hypothetical protein
MMPDLTVTIGQLVLKNPAMLIPPHFFYRKRQRAFLVLFYY